MIRFLVASSVIDFWDLTLSLLVSGIRSRLDALTPSTRRERERAAMDQRAGWRLEVSYALEWECAVDSLVKKNSATSDPAGVWTMSYGFNRPCATAS